MTPGDDYKNELLDDLDYGIEVIKLKARWQGLVDAIAKFRGKPIDDSPSGATYHRIANLIDETYEELQKLEKGKGLL